jgi:hypothetical protein
MKLLVSAILIAFLTVLPVVLVGIRHGDGAYTDNTYNRSLDYDKGKAIASREELVWSEPECENAETCTIGYSGDTKEWINLSVRVFIPTDSDELLIYEGGMKVRFRYVGTGWYIVKLDYTESGVLVSREKTFYIK